MHQRLVLIALLVLDGQPIDHLQQNIRGQSHWCECDADVEQNRVHTTPQECLQDNEYVIDIDTHHYGRYIISCDDSHRYVRLYEVRMRD